MKIRELLKEFVAPPALKALTQLVDAVEGNQLNPQSQQQAKVLLAKIEAELEKTEKAQQPEQTVAEQVNYAQLIDQLVGNLEDRLENPNETQKILNAMRQAGVNDQMIYKLIDLGREVEFQAGLEWNDQLKASAVALADKVVRNSEIIHAALETEAPTNVAEAVEIGSSMKGKIVDILRTMFELPYRNERERQAFERKKQLTAQFMEKCKVGVIDFNDIIANDKPNANIDELVSNQDREIYSEIRDKAFGAVPSTTAGAWGPGEIGLSLLATPVTKGTVGDLRVLTKDGAIEVELKGMQEAKAGGRFNSNAVAKAKDAAKEYRRHFDSFYKGLNEIIDVPDPREAFTVVKNIKTGATKLKRPETFDLEAINKVWNPKLILPASQANPKRALQLTKRFLAGIADSAVLDEGKQYAKSAIVEMTRDPDIIVMNNDGSFTLNWLGIQANISKILYSVYAGVDKKGVIMYFNTMTSNYYIVQGPDDMKTRIKDGTLKTGNSIIDFAAGQSPASPQVGIA
jgi:hypothetical protein